MSLHYRKMNGIACGETLILQNNLLRSHHNFRINWQDLIRYVQQCIKSWLDSVATIDCHISMKDLL